MYSFSKINVFQSAMMSTESQTGIVLHRCYKFLFVGTQENSSNCNETSSKNSKF